MNLVKDDKKDLTIAIEEALEEVVKSNIKVKDQLKIEQSEGFPQTLFRFI